MTTLEYTLTTIIRDLKAQLKAQREIVAADDNYFASQLVAQQANYRTPKTGLTAAVRALNHDWGVTRCARKAAEQLDKETKDAQ